MTGRTQQTSGKMRKRLFALENYAFCIFHNGGAGFFSFDTTSPDGSGKKASVAGCAIQRRPVGRGVSAFAGRLTPSIALEHPSLVIRLDPTRVQVVIPA